VANSIGRAQRPDYRVNRPGGKAIICDVWVTECKSRFVIEMTRPIA
jgi:hypothetical protein